MAGRQKRKLNADEKRIVRDLCGIFCTKTEVASILHCDVKILDRLCAEAFDYELGGCTGFADAFAAFSATGRRSIRRKQLELALEGDKTMLVWLGKNYLGQSEDGSESDRSPAALTAEQVTDKLTVMRSRSPVYRKAAGDGGA